MEDKAARLEVGYGLEGTLTDAIAHRTLESELAPSFARGAYFDGLDATLKADLRHRAEHLSAEPRAGPEHDVAPKAHQHAAHEVGTHVARDQRGNPSRAHRVGTAGHAGAAGALGDRMAAVAARARRRTLRRRRRRRDRLGSLVRDIGRGIGNLRARRAWSDGMERFEFSTIVGHACGCVFWVAALLVPTAAVVIIAGGGEFGGAGSLIHW